MDKILAAPTAIAPTDIIYGDRNSNVIKGEILQASLDRFRRITAHHSPWLAQKFPRNSTLKEETFAGRNFRGFVVFSQIRESLFPRNFSKDVIRESFFPRNFLKKSSSANILKKNTLL